MSTSRDELENAPLIRAVIPVHNRETIIVRAIESVLAQSSPAHDIIVVDDGSTDGTWDALQRFGARVTAIRQDNLGAARARSTGALHPGSGPDEPEWIAFLDSDDVWDVGHLERASAAILATDGRATMYFADTVRSPSNGGGSLWGEAGFSIDSAHELAADASAWVLLDRQPMMLQSSVFSSAAFANARNVTYDLPVREDTRLFFELGLGRAACAVRGVGARMTDDGGEGRLTHVHDVDSKVYWEATRALYRDLLSSVKSTKRSSLDHAASAEFARRLAGAHLRLARDARSVRAFGAMAAHLVRALRVDPSRFFEAVGRRVGRR